MPGAVKLRILLGHVIGEFGQGFARTEADAYGQTGPLPDALFWLKDESLEDSDNLPAPEIIAQEIVDDLEAALEQFRLISDELKTEVTENGTASVT